MNHAAVLKFWFGDDPDDLQVIRQSGKLWFGKDERVDADIRQRFGSLVKDAASITAEAAAGFSARERLATVILLDQFPRNIHRGTARSFAYDPAALMVAKAGLESRQDRQLRPVERVFLYLPLEHSESLEEQNRCVTLFQGLLDEVPETWKKSFAGFLDYAVRHRDIIARFGRFPHRNSILGRSSSAEEQAFLTQPNSSF